MDIAALVISITSAIVSCLAWRATERTWKATIFETKLDVYKVAVQFVSDWMSKGRPDTGDGLRALVRAWDKSHYLYSRAVTAALRQMWLDAVQAEIDLGVIKGEYDGNRDEAIARKTAFALKYSDDALRKIFQSELRV